MDVGKKMGTDVGMDVGMGVEIEVVERSRAYRIMLN